MAKNWALVIGINGYNPLNFTPLKYAKRDAEQVKTFFEKAGFEVSLFTDDSPSLPLPSGQRIPTQPSYGNLISFLEDRFKKPFLKDGDNCWFFFAGHGERHRDRDYLMPMDANSRGTEVIAGLTVNYVRERLSRCGADNVVMLLDACRSQGSRDSAGIGRDFQKGLITISSCQPTQKSWEIDELLHGAFTHALLEALELPGEQSCATVERLGNHLKQRVPELCERYGKSPSQMPRISVDPIEKQHFILIPKYARQADINQLKLDVYRLQRTNPVLAEKICIRLNALAMGQDLEVIDLLTDIRNVVRSSPVSAPTATDSARTASATAETLSVGKVVEQKISPVSQPVKQPKTSDQPALKSEKGVDYSKLRDLLKAGDWEAADNETYEVMIRAVGKKLGDWFTTDELLNFPCADLLTIDGLWVHYSQGRFGFSVQKKIYIECGAKLDGTYPGDKIWEKFGDNVGWRKSGVWVGYSSLVFSISAPSGHLPYRIFYDGDIFGLVYGGGHEEGCSLLSHRDL